MRALLRAHRPRSPDRALELLHRLQHVPRIAAILQGVYKRATEGLASSNNALQHGQNAKALAELGWRYAERA